MMINRKLHNLAFNCEWGRQMRFITGPRQVGKTTLAKNQLKISHCDKLYYLWDLRTVKNRYKNNELFFTEDSLPQKNKQWVCFDEIHKYPGWKNVLKGIYDSSFENYNFIVTGSSKLNVDRRAGDSLAGRYFTFNLFPLMLCEIINNPDQTFSLNTANEYISLILDSSPASFEAANQLINNSGFPEPFLSQSSAFRKKWRTNYVDTVIREDISLLTQIIDREKIYDLYKLLPEMIGSPISESSIASHIQVSPITAKKYLHRLEDFYLLFSIRPFSKNIKRSLLKSPKIYFYDWTLPVSPGARFENYVACELYSRTTLWSEETGDDFSLFYIRNKQKQETDFLITRNKKPWLLVEAKLKDCLIERHHFNTIEALNNIPFVQICLENGIASLQKKNVYRISASRFFVV